jgi:hypothetical protein
MEVLRQKGENSDFKAMGSSTTLLNSSACAHNSLQPALMCRKGAFHANGLERIELTAASIFLKPSALEPTPIVLERTCHQQPSAYHNARKEVIQALVGSSARFMGLNTIYRTGKNTNLY